MSTNNNETKRHWFFKNRLYATSDFGALALIYNSKRRCEIIFWFCLMAIFAVFAVKDLSALVLQWIKHDTVTQMTLSQRNVIVLPNLTLCVLMPLPDFNLFHDSRNILHVYSGPEYPYWGILNETLERLDTKEKFLNEFWLDEYILMPLVNRYFLAMFSSESFGYRLGEEWLDFRKFPPITEDGRMFVANQELSNSMYLSLNKPAHALNEHRKKLNITTLEYFHKFETELIWLFDIGVIHKRHGKGAISRPEKIYLSWLEIDRFCFVFDPADCGEYCEDRPDKEMRSDLDDSVKIRLYLDEVRKIFDPEMKGNRRTFAPLPGTSILDFGGRITENETLNAAKMRLFFGETLPMASTPEFEIKYGVLSYSSMEIAARYEAIENCSNEFSYNSCRREKRAKVIQEVCDCEPLFYGNRERSEKLCSYEKYLECLHYNASEIFEMQELCQPDCRRDVYRFQRFGSYSEKSFDTRDELVVHLNFPPGAHPTFIQVYAVSWHNFVGNLGGILDFWLGASLFSVIHLFYFLSKQICRRKSKEEKTTESEPKLLEQKSIAHL